MKRILTAWFSFANDTEGLTPEQTAEEMKLVYARGDRFMGYFVLIHTGIALFLATFYRTWEVTLPVTLAIVAMFFGSRALLPGSLFTRSVAGIALQAFCGLHIYQMHGLWEMHFFFFTAQTKMIVYQDWRATWAGTLLLIAQHILFAFLQNTGSQLYFFPESYVTVEKLCFHFGIALFQVAICNYWSILHRRYRLRIIYQRMQAEEARKMTEQAMTTRSQFLANMSHEIRTPMNVLIGMSRLLLDSDLQPPQKEFARTIQKGSEGLLVVINDVLDFSKLDAGKMTIDAADFQPGPVVEETCGFLSQQAHRKGLEFTCNLAADLPSGLCGDSGRLRQILTNLIGNAIKFTDQGEIRVLVTLLRVVGSQVWLRFEVEDTGIGFSPADKERLFESFTQADGSTTRKYGGTGLGLPISRCLATLMGGTLDAESKPGHGSKFILDLPFDPPQSVPCVAQLPLPRSTRVLVVDDHAATRQVIEQYLWRCGVLPTLVETAAQALQRLTQAVERGQPYDVVLVDQRLKEMAGTALAAHIHRDPQLTGTPMILMTCSDQEIEWSKDRGLTGVLQKPVRRDALWQAIMRAVSRHAPPPPVEPTAPALVEEQATILVVEDNEDNQRLAMWLLRKHGYGCRIVSNGREALEALAARPYPLVLMDCQMPEMDGMQATALIRQTEKGSARRTPIIAMTAHALAGDRQKCLDAGMDDYLSKPINEKEMMATIERWRQRSPFIEPVTLTPPEASITVQPQIGMEQMVAVYLANRQHDLEALAGAIEARDWQAAKVIGHNLKGSGAGFGMPILGDIGSSIEQCAIAKDGPGVAAQLAALSDYLSRVHLVA